MTTMPIEHLPRILAASLLYAGLAGMTAFGQTTSPSVKADGSVTSAGFTVPYSGYASAEARAFFPKMLEQGSHAPPLALAITVSIEPSRAFYGKINEGRVQRMQKIYPVKISAETIAGVKTDVVLPAQGIGKGPQQRVLINLHGGGFLWGAHSGGLVESIPVASLGRIKVVTVDYRQGPEHVFPAASEDVEAVYRALLKAYPAKNIGIYGCSAGGVLTGEAVARIISKKLPVPGAIGTFCGSIVAFDGDSSIIAPVLNGEAAPTGALDLAKVLPYFKGASPSDPMVYPGNSLAILAKFPPTLLITGTRDFTMSSELKSQQLLTNAGVDAELHVWDGMWHSFFSDPEMPESREAYAVMVSFFDRHLGH
jgi:monoterpene epsilon-lactone hydrolase